MSTINTTRRGAPGRWGFMRRSEFRPAVAQRLGVRGREAAARRGRVSDGTRGDETGRRRVTLDDQVLDVLRVGAVEAERGGALEHSLGRRQVGQTAGELTGAAYELGPLRLEAKHITTGARQAGVDRQVKRTDDQQRHQPQHRVAGRADLEAPGGLPGGLGWIPTKDLHFRPIPSL